MKKKVLFVASIFLATATFAQDGLTSKKGEAYLPEAGDWSIGFDAGSLTSYFGNAFNGASGNSLNAGGWMNGTVRQEIRVKMFKDETTAYRMRVRIGFGSSASDSIGMYDPDASALTADEEFIINTKQSDGFSVILGAGLEKRRGNTRVQGYYGGEVFFGMLGNGTTTIDDGRVLSDLNDGGVNSPGTARVTEVANGSTIRFGLAGFLGVEYFFAPKMSLGAEYAWGIDFSSTGEGTTTSEYWGNTAVEIANGGVPNHLISEEMKTGKSGSFSIDTDGRFQLNLAFHF